MKSTFGSALLLVGLAHTASAQEKFEFVPRIEFECGEAKVVIDSSPKGFRSPEEAFVKTGMQIQAQITVTRAGSSITFRSWQSIDYIGGTCINDAQGKPHIVYQAFCGGSGCDDLTNWGIIDAREIHEELTPGVHNGEQAREILGSQPPRLYRLISLLAAAYASPYPSTLALSAGDPDFPAALQGTWASAPVDCSRLGQSTLKINGTVVQRYKATGRVVGAPPKKNEIEVIFDPVNAEQAAGQNVRTYRLSPDGERLFEIRQDRVVATRTRCEALR
jgi:hypothetical protein